MCQRCRRPQSVCYCPLLPSLVPRTQVVFLQHPRERRVAISTCRMAHLALAGSSLHHGVLFDGHPVVEELARRARDGAGVALLFPGPGSIDPASLPPGWLETLVVVDGTWSQARKLVQRNRLLAGLPRLGLWPARPSNYRIRREPDEQSVSTIEAVVEVLGRLEGEPERFAAALRAFEHMVDVQIARRLERSGPGRHKRKRQRLPWRPALPPAVAAALGRAVLFHVEANGGPGPDGRPLPAELVQLVALRPASGERLSLLVRPRAPLGPSVPLHLELAPGRLAEGVVLAAAQAAWAGFARADDLLVGWGHFGHRLLCADVPAAAALPFLDLRVFTSRQLGRRAGGVESAAGVVAADGEAAEGRAGRRLGALAAIFSRLPADR